MSTKRSASALPGFPPQADASTAEAFLVQENISGAVFERSFWLSDLQIWAIFYTAASTSSLLLCATDAEGLTTNGVSNWSLSKSKISNDALPATETSQTYDLLSSQDASISGTQLTLVVDSSSLTVPALDNSLAVNHPCTGSVSLLGDLVQNHTVDLLNTLTDLDGLNNLSYQWQKRGADVEGNWVSIDGANSADFQPGTDEAGYFLRVQISYTDDLGYQETVISQVSTSLVLANQAPTIENQSVYAARGEAYTFKATDFGFVDADAGDTLNSVSILNLPSFGQLSLDASPVTAISDGGFLSISMAQLEAGLLQFLPDTNSSSPLSEDFSYMVVDSHLTSSADPGLLKLQDSSRPTSSNVQIDATVNSLVYLRPDDFDFSDSDGDSFYAISVTQLPIHGALTLGGVAVKLNQIITWEAMWDVGFGYTPAGSGSSYEHVQFKVSDGKVSSNSAYDLQFNITDPDNASGGVDIAGQVRHWKGLTPVPVTEVSIAIGSNTTVTTDTSGHFTLTGADLSNGSQVNATVATPFASKTDAGITLTDVLATLKVYLGRDLPSDYASPFNVVAADFDANGVVNLSDVLGLLKYYLGRTSVGASVPTWAFVNADDVTSDGHIVGANGNNLSKSYVSLDAVSLATDPSMPITLIGVVRGDVDGSWALAHPAVI